MIINNIKLEQYRNIKKLEIKPCENINLIYGDNAQGKTNLIESIWMFTGNQSFRISKLNDIIPFNLEYSKMSIDFSDNDRKQNISYLISSKKKIKINNVEIKTSNELFGCFYAVVFSPSDLSFLKESPKNRRQFLDISISQIKTQYRNYISLYENLIEQRNALLKKSYNKREIVDSIDVWDIQISKIGTIISIYRNDYIKKLKPIIKDFYYGISKQKENLSIYYKSNIFNDDIGNINYTEDNVLYYYKILKENIDKDIKLGFTTVGIQRDDIDFFINKNSLYKFGSQGQQRSAIITLKLAEAHLLKKITNENPIILLDDVMSELDLNRQDYLLNNLENMQVFITCCDIHHTLKLKKGMCFKICNGEIIDIKKIGEL